MEKMVTYLKHSDKTQATSQDFHTVYQHGEHLQLHNLHKHWQTGIT